MTGNLTEHRGNLFDSQARMLGIPVNIVGVAGRGLALEARRRHPDWYYYYKEACRRKRFDLHRLQVYRPEGNYPYRLLSVPTKRHWRDDSSLDDLKIVLAHLRHQCWEHRDNLAWQSLALPPLGCGNGHLDYEAEVRPLMYEYLADLPIRVEIWSL